MLHNIAHMHFFILRLPVLRDVLQFVKLVLSGTPCDLLKVRVQRLTQIHLHFVGGEVLQLPDNFMLWRSTGEYLRFAA